MNMKEPDNVKTLESFLSITTYVAKFIPNVSQITAPLRELTKKGVIWHWGKDQAIIIS